MTAVRPVSFHLRSLRPSRISSLPSLPRATAEDAQHRIVTEVEACLARPQEGDILFVGHGGVGTLLLCALSGIGIDRRFDQGPGGGGCWFAFDAQLRRPQCGWQPMEALMTDN